MRIEVLHVRDPDTECDVTVFLNGKRVEADELLDVDPGRGHERAEWDAVTEAIRNDTRLSPQFRAAVVQARTAAADSDYIEET